MAAVTAARWPRTIAMFAVVAGRDRVDDPPIIVSTQLCSRRVGALLLLLAVAACSSPSPATDIDAAVDGAIDAAADAPYQDDGVPTRQPCTNNLGSGLTTAHGRLDGYLVAIVPPGFRGCNGDSDHVHLQVRMAGDIYDVAINVSDPADVDYLATDLPLPDGPWQEGWHPGPDGLLDYPSLGVHAGAFVPTPMTTLTAAIDAELADVNHISVFMTGYGPDGGHLVHRNRGTDGAVVVRPLGAARLLMFKFSTNAF